MKTKRLLTPQFFIGAVISAFIFFILSAVLATFLYMKNIDIKGIKKDHEYLLKQYEIFKKERAIDNSIEDYVDRARSMTDYNEEAVIVPDEEGK